MKRAAAFLALVGLFFAGLALANTGTLTAITGTAQVQTGTTSARTLRVGDLVRQGDTVITGAASSAVIRFEDGQVTALTANSRMQITAYQYNPQAQSGNILLSLVDGGMRAITGLIGNRTPANVSYRAATATIGIRGTDITIVTSAGNVIVTVTDGVISFRLPGQTQPTIVAKGNAVLSNTSAGTLSTNTIAAIIAAAAAANPALGAEVQSVQTQLTGALADAIATAVATPSASSTRTTQVISVVAVNSPSAGGGSPEGFVNANCSVSGTTAVCSCPPTDNGSFVLSVTGTTGTCTLRCNTGFANNCANVCTPPGIC